MAIMNTKERLYTLDILKFISAILIAIWHLYCDIGVTFKYSDIIFKMFRLDNVVDLFFIISGFLSLYNIKKTSFDEYFKHKINNLYPLAIISVIIEVILMLIYKIKFSEDWFNTPLGIWRIINSLLITTTGQATKIDLGINNPLWYVSVLMVCYVVFWFATKDENKDYKYILLGLCLFGLGIHEYQIDLPFINAYIGRGFAGYFLGTCLCIFYQSRMKQFTKKYAIVFPTMLLFIILSLLLYDYSYFMDNKWCIDTFVIMPLIVITFLMLNKYLANSKKLSVLSNISYSIYVWHNEILTIYSIIQIKECNFFDMCIYVIICLIWSIMSYTLFEKKLRSMFNRMF